MSVPFTSTAYLYPWDVMDDPASADLIAGLGVESATIAAAYHSVRAATPRHPDHRVVDAASAALYVPVRPAAWANRRLVPREATAWAGDTPFARAREVLAARGLAAQAWITVTHSSAVASAAPDLQPVNAFGDRYSYALCPSSAEVVDYAATLVSEVATQAGVDRFVVEACGPMGLSHQSQHSKTDGADWTATDENLLSICFCAACVLLYAQRDLDTDQLRHRVRGSVGGGQADPEEALGELATVVLEVRRTTALSLRQHLVEAARAAGVTRIGFHASTDPWSTGPAAALIDDAPAVQSYVIDAWSPGVDSVARIAAARSLDLGGAEVAAYVTVLGADAPDQAALAVRWRSLLDAGADQLHIYNAGLASTARLDAARGALAALRAT